MSVTTTIKSCEVCGNTDLVPLLDLGPQPMCDDLVPIGSSLVPHKYPLNLLGCEKCVTVLQGVQVEKELLFPQTYHYRAALTKDVLDGMQELVDSTKQLVGDLDSKTVLDIGCNDGSLLNIFRAEGAYTCGIEPTGAVNDAQPKVNWLYHGFFDARAVQAYLAENEKPDVITFTNVFAHIEDLNGLLDNVAKLLGEETKLVIENHYLGAVVQRTQFDTFYHEHPRTYSYRSFEVIAERLGRNIIRVDFPNRYNGNIRIVIGNGVAAPKPGVDETSFLDEVQSMESKIGNERKVLRSKLEALASKYGALPAKAFPGRASILIHTLGIDEHLIDATYERSSSPKIGHYIPGTKIEIRDEAEFLKGRMSSPVLVNLAWHIQSEIEQYMRLHAYEGAVIPIWE